MVRRLLVPALLAVPVPGLFGPGGAAERTGLDERQSSLQGPAGPDRPDGVRAGMEDVRAVRGEPGPVEQQNLDAARAACTTEQNDAGFAAAHAGKTFAQF